MSSESEVRAATATALREAGARFALVFGSRAPGGTPGPASDLDVAAWWSTDPPAPWERIRDTGSSSKSTS